MKKILFALTTLVLFSCKETSTTPAVLEVNNAQTTVPDTSVALKFINSYVENCNTESLSIGKFVDASPYATEKLKKG